MPTDLLNVQVEDSQLQITIHAMVIALGLIAFALPIITRFKVFTKKNDIELKIKLGGIGSVTIKPNNEVKQIAHKAWVELKTRKAGLAIDKENDVISDVYRSWYVLFGEIRNLARDVPAHKLNDEDTKKLVDLLVESLNNGLRPHLTLWRAKYERWYEKAVEDSQNQELTPQDIQKKYKQYEELVEDMLKINKQLVQYTNELKKLVDA